MAAVVSGLSQRTPIMPQNHGNLDGEAIRQMPDNIRCDSLRHTPSGKFAGDASADKDTAAVRFIPSPAKVSDSYGGLLDSEAVFLEAFK
jgi:hypothetical protein